MEENLIRDYFRLPEVDVKSYSPLTLAFLGDGVYEIIVRTIVVSIGNNHPNRLHNMSAHIVKAHSQRLMVEALEPYLTDEERDVLRRGRNAKSYTHAKNASVSDYRIATGFEALLGYLYLKDDQERILWLIRKGFDETGLLDIRPSDREETNK
ncbi:MAG: ribonuclease III [Lachnospiraceae bacterium]|nr:ribonuclease III [Lachnospiraceae bacterium]